MFFLSLLLFQVEPTLFFFFPPLFADRFFSEFVFFPL